MPTKTGDDKTPPTPRDIIEMFGLKYMSEFYSLPALKDMLDPVLGEAAARRVLRKVKRYRTARMELPDETSDSR